MGCWLGLRALKTRNFYFCQVIKKIKNKLKGFLQRILQEVMRKNNTWNIDEKIEPAYHIEDCQSYNEKDFKNGMRLYIRIESAAVY